MMTRPNPTADDTRADTLPSGFIRYEHDLADSPTTLYAGLGHTQRFPDYWELFSPNSGPAGSVNAFDSIKPEKTTQLDVGLQYKTEALEAWASAYVGQVRDYILFDYTPGMMGTTSQAENIDARIMGGELGAAYKLTDHWKTDATLAYAWGKNSSDGSALPQMPPLDARFGLTYSREPIGAPAHCGEWSPRKTASTRTKAMSSARTSTRPRGSACSRSTAPTGSTRTGRSVLASTTCSARRTPNT